MSPILLRPIREQLEHDRVIRQLQTRWRRRFDVGINVGNDEEVSVRSGDRTCYPDLVLTSTAGGRRLHGVVEVETAESVNHLEAMAEWSHFAIARGAFYLYVPAGFTDVALRLCETAHVNVTEIWAYYAIGTQAKFSMAYRSPRARQRAKAAKATVAKSSKASAKSSKKPATKNTKKKKSKAGTSSSKSKTASAMKMKRSKTGAKKAAKATKRAPAKRAAAKKAKTKPKSKAKTAARVKVRSKTKAKTVTKRSSKPRRA